MNSVRRCSLKFVDIRGYIGIDVGIETCGKQFLSQTMLTDAEILDLKPKHGVYKHSLGEGLFVLIRPDGKKYWRLKYRFNGRDTTYAIGVFPHVTVDEAMKARASVRETLRQGADPNQVKREEKEFRQKLSSQSVFRLAMSSEDELTIATASNVVTLNSDQTKALRGFLVATPQTEQGGQQ